MLHLERVNLSGYRSLEIQIHHDGVRRACVMDIWADFLACPFLCIMHEHVHAELCRALPCTSYYMYCTCYYLAILC